MYLLLWIDTYYTALCVLGMYSGDEDVDDSSLFICERHALTDLLDGLKAPCSCGTTCNPWTLDSTIQVRSNFSDKSEVQNLPIRRGTSFALHSAVATVTTSRGPGLAHVCSQAITSSIRSK